jgi:hypothetical protein
MEGMMLKNIGIVLAGVLLLPFYLVASIILGEDVIEYCERKKKT